MRIIERLGADRVVMILCAAVGMARGTMYTFLPGASDLSGHMILLDDYIPVLAYGLIWYLCGFVAMAGLFIRKVVPVVYGMFIGLSTLWTVVFLASWIVGFSPNGFVSSVSYAGKAIMLYLLARNPHIEPSVVSLTDEELEKYTNGGENV